MSAMKTLHSSFLLSLLGIVLFLSSCHNQKKAEPVKADQGFQEYISAYTFGTISSKGVIRVRLTQEFAQDVEPGTELDKNVFSFEPEIKGKAYWADSRTIELKPTETLESGTRYKGFFMLKNVVPVKEKFNRFPLEVQVIKQTFLIKSGQLQPINDSKSYNYSGELVTADVMDDANVEALLKAQINGKEKNISWEHNTSKNTHQFVVEDIERQDVETQLDLLWDGNSIGIKEADTRSIEIPGLSNFKLINAQVFHQPSQYVLLTFSDVLKKDQNLKGLIRIKGESNIKCLIDDNTVKVFANKHMEGSHDITINQAVKNSMGYRMKEDFTQTLTFEATKPEIRLVGKGVIIPNSNGLNFPFEAVNLKAVDVRIIKIYENNVAQFLQVNAMDEGSYLRRVGRLVVNKKIELTSDNLIDYAQWNAFSIDLSKLIENEPGAIYQVELRMKKKYSLYDCPGDDKDEDDELQEENWDEESNNELSYWDGCESYYYGDYYRWSDRNDPCTEAYYKSRKVSRNVLASNIGLIAKAGNNNELRIFASDIITAQPLANVEVTILNYQQQPLGSTKTDENGMGTIPYDMKPFLLVAKNGNERGYLKLNDGASLSLSKFDVGGVKYEKGIKGFIYGDRGVWRPGDTIYTTFILEDKDQLLPPEHPVCFELINPYGKIVKRMIKSSGINGFYQFTFATKDEDMTGNWMARVKVGGATFTKQLKVETVKPNRLKINLDFGKDKLYRNDKNIKGDMEVKWLHGAVAQNLQANVIMELKPIKTSFMSYNDYVFDNPSVNFSVVEQEVFSSKLDANGKAVINPEIDYSGDSPGMLKAVFNTKVFEEGGDFSVNQISIPYAPYDNFVGVKVPKGDKRRGMLLTDVKHKIDVVTLDADGNKVSVKGLTGKLYKIEWRWWWQSGNDNIGNYIERKHLKPIVEKEFSTNNGFGSFNIEVKYPDWGRYIVVVESPSGHSTGKTVYIDWPGWAGRAQDENSGGASMLTFSAEKDSYKVGEKVNVTFPSSEGGRALVTVEKGSRVVEAFWIDTKAEQTTFSFDVSSEMSPNVYVNVTTLQPHGQTQNDHPIRRYGVIPIMVNNPETKLQPEISMPDELKPESEVNIKVSEKNGKPMTFTLAVVDEGLLDLTNFRTPDPHQSFYAREGLSVRTWDLYDLILGAYGAKIESVFAIGGDGEMEADDGRKAQRFKPVVKFFGPYTIKDAGEKNIHFKMPRYVGSVKAMVVAGDKGAYGSTDKAVPVRSPLMLFATLPRVLSPGEKVKLPVTLFAMDDKIKTVNVKVKTNSLLNVEGNSTRTVTFDKMGEQDFSFELSSAEAMGIAKVELEASCGKEKATYVVEMDIRTPNPPKIKTYSKVLNAGETWEQNFEVFGLKGTNSAVLEVSGMPSINLNKRLHYLIRYPYGCIEQTTSSVFPQLYLSDIMELDNNTKKRIKDNVSSAIERLISFQKGNGGFAYWPGNTEVDEWGTNYAGHFILEAEERGYTLPVGMKSSWLSYQSDMANEWIFRSNRYGTNGFIQAYRLYTLALADQSNLGAMNRLKECEKLSKQGKYYLSMAYLLSGNKDAAVDIFNSFTPNSTASGYYLTYGSSDRDKAIYLESLLALESFDEAMPIINEISKKLNSEMWMSTQTTAFCLRAMCKAAEVFKKANDEFAYNYSLNKNRDTKVKTSSIVNQHEITLDESNINNVLRLKNKSKTPFYVNLAIEGTPLKDTDEKEEKNLKMNVVYKTLDGNIINPNSIAQSTDFKVEITVKNSSPTTNYKNMALTMMFPSGWEIINTRLNGSGNIHMIDMPDYQDIRDDRVNSFFDLKAGQSKTFVTLLNASYLGEFTMPAIQCSAMYDNNIRARIPGRTVSVIE